MVFSGMFWGALGDTPCFLARRNRAGLFLNKRFTWVAECFDRTKATMFLDEYDEGCTANGAAHRSIPILGREQRRRDMVVATDSFSLVQLPTATREVGIARCSFTMAGQTTSTILSRYFTMSSDDDHYLGSYLSEILPAIGLDVETYAPYVTGYVSHKSLFLCLYFLH